MLTTQLAATASILVIVTESSQHDSHFAHMVRYTCGICRGAMRVAIPIS